MNVGRAFVYVDYGDAKIKDTLLAVGYENNNISFLAFNANWKFLKV